MILTQVGYVGETPTQKRAKAAKQRAEKRGADEQVDVELKVGHCQEGRGVDQRADERHDDRDLTPSAVTVGHKHQGDDQRGDCGEEVCVKGEERCLLLYLLGTEKERAWSGLKIMYGPTRIAATDR